MSQNTTNDMICRQEVNKVTQDNRISQLKASKQAPKPHIYDQNTITLTRERKLTRTYLI